MHVREQATIHPKCILCFYCACERQGQVSHLCTHLFKAGRHAPAAGLHDAVVAAHVLADLPVLFAPLLSAGHNRRITEERRNTVTGQSADSEGGGQGETERSVSSLASQQQEDEKVKGREEGECGGVAHLTKLYRSWSKTASFGAQTLRGVKNIRCLWLQTRRK